MTNWSKLLKDAEVGEVDASAARNVVVEVPAAVIRFVEQLKTPGPSGRKRKADVPIPDGEDWTVLRATFKAAGDHFTPKVSVTVKPVFAEGDEEQITTTVGSKTVTKWIPKNDATPGWLRLTVGPRRGGPGARVKNTDSSTDESAQ